MQTIHFPVPRPVAAAARKHARRILRLTLSAALFFAPGAALLGQTGGEAGIQGTVSDATGAAIPNASVAVKNTATGVVLTRQTDSSGLYSVSPIIPGKYTVTVTAQGFEKYVQNNLQADALVMTALNVQMKIGATDTTVEVSAAPPALETTNATLSLTIENTTYANLPLQLNGAQRDPTAFGSLAPGAQGGARLPIIGGTGNYLGQLYLDGLPAETVSQQGDNRLVSLAVDVDSIDQMQVLTSTPPAEYSGAGAENFTMKSGSLQWHGSVKDFVRNTTLDAWQFVKPATKPIDHQNELSATLGGHVPGTKRVFFFVAYDRYHNRSQNTAQNWTVPTTQMRTGDFSQLACLQIANSADQAACVAAGGPSGTSGTATYGSTTIPIRPIIFDPTSNALVNGTYTRSPFVGSKNGVASYNVIPSNYISPIAQAMQQYLPAPTNSNIVNNYVAGFPTGFDNHVFNYRIDFQINEKHRISTVGALGTENYLNNVGTGPYLPLPYTGGDLANIFPKIFDVQDAYTISNSMVNQLKFGFVRFFQNIHSWTQDSSTYGIGKFGITNLPAGQAGTSFPGAQFGTSALNSTATTNWTGTTSGVTTQTSTQLTTPNNYALVDNLQWTKGAHNLTFGIEVQWQEINNANPATLTPNLNLYYDALSTANYVNGQLSTGTSTSNSTGYAYASYLLGAVVGSSSTAPPSLALQTVSEVGGRYRPIAPYVEDTWKVNSKLTIDAGLRWDYLPPYREVKNRWSFLNPNLTNPATGTPGALQFAGNYGGAGASCNCTTPINTYWNNWGPRVGITYQSDPKTVWRIGAGRVFSQGGGVGGRGGAFNGTGQLGFNTTATGPNEVLTGAGAGPSFYLNNSAAFQAKGIANTDLFGAGYQYPAPPAPGAATESLDAGHYINQATGKVVTASSAPGYADPYFSGRAPDFMFYNAGIEHAFTSNLTMAINYVGNESHHLIDSTNSGTGNPRGYWSNELNPKYLVALGGSTDSTGKLPLLTAPANSANVAKAQSIMSSIAIPGFFQAAANAGDTTATIAQGLVTFPQYSSVTDTYGANVGNFSYNSLQVTVQQRFAHGLTFNFNYTWARNVGDDGPFRTGYDLPSGSVSGTSQSFHMNRIDRSETAVSTPNVIHAFAVWDLPFGKNHMGGDNRLVRALAGGWQINGIYTYASGTPALITYSGCTTPLQGQCMPDLATTYHGSARINGGFGKSATGGRLASNLGHVQYFNVQSFQTPQLISPAGVAALNLIGNAPRTGAYDLRNPATWGLNTGIRRTFPLYERLAFTFEADAFNTLNHVIFGNPNATWGPGSTSFGTVTGTSSSYSPRQIELAGHVTF